MEFDQLTLKFVSMTKCLRTGKKFWKRAIMGVGQKKTFLINKTRC